MVRSQDKRKKTRGRAGKEDVMLGGNLRLHRRLACLSQQKLAEMVGITFQQIQKYEKGDNRMSAVRLRQFSKIFNIPMEAFWRDIAEKSEEGYSALDWSQQDVRFIGALKKQENQALYSALREFVRLYEAGR